VNEEEAVKIFDLVVKEHMLPATLDKLVPLSFIGAAAVKFYQAKVKLMDQLGMSVAQRKATLADGQDAGEMLLNIEARIGELYESLPAKPGVKAPEGRAGGKTATIEKAGIDQFKAMRAQTIHRNPAAVAKVIKEARDNEDIPTKTAVLAQIKLDRVKELQKDKIPENQRVGKILSEDEFAEWTAWGRIAMSVGQRKPIAEMSSKAQEEIGKLLDRIEIRIAEIREGK
jgi:hypothetical protein